MFSNGFELIGVEYNGERQVVRWDVFAVVWLLQPILACACECKPRGSITRMWLWGVGRPFVVLLYASIAMMVVLSQEAFYCKKRVKIADVGLGAVFVNCAREHVRAVAFCFGSS